MLMKGAAAQKSKNSAPASGNKVLEKAQSIKVAPADFKYDYQEGMPPPRFFLFLVILYNLGLGAKRTDLKWVFEGADNFEVLPTFGVVPQFNAQSGFPLADLLPNFSPVFIPPRLLAYDR